MRANYDYTIEQLLRYLEIPSERRSFARYCEELLHPSVAFSADEVERLCQVVHLGQADYPKSQIGKLLIDLSWASSKLEGNTYTQLDTQVLIQYGQKNENKPAEEAAMILNHKRAIEFMLEHKELMPEVICQIHAFLADASLAMGSRHFLEPTKCGVIRSYTPNGLAIDGSSYLPPQAEDRPLRFIEQSFEALLSASVELPDAINQSFFLMTRLPYLQPFYDVNKRTSRISCNIPLIKNGLSPLSFVDFDKEHYIKGLIAFYELGDERLAKQAFLDAYISSALRYLPFGENERVALAINFHEHFDETRRFVIEGVQGESAIWLKKRHTPIK